MTRAAITPSGADISHGIVDALYEQALDLSEHVRLAFALRSPLERERRGLENETPLQAAMASEGLRTTTRMLHVLAWLLNQRAHLAGDISAFQLRRCGPLPADDPSDPAAVILLPIEVQELIEASEALHSRIARLDGERRDRFTSDGSAVARLRRRLDAQVGADRRAHERF